MSESSSHVPLRTAETPESGWTPTADAIAGSNLSELMRRLDCASYDALHRWSVTERDAFWREVIADLGIQFEDSPDAIRGSDDVTDPDWLPGAVFNIVESCLDHDPDATAIVAGTADTLRRISVSDLRSMVAGFAAGFRKAGFVPGDAIAIVMPMTVEAVVAYLGTIASGGVVVSVADSFAPDEIRARLDITSPVAVVTQDVSTRLGRTLDMYVKCVDAGAGRCIVVETDAGIELRQGDIHWGDFVVPDAPLTFVRSGASTITNVLFSSGTTGVPKAIPWTQTTPIKAAMDGRFHQDIHSEDVVAWPTNLGWMMGPWLIYASLLNGAAIALYDDAPTESGFIDFVAAAGVSVLGIVPSIVGVWRSGGLLSAGDWDRVRVISSTGEASVADDAQWLMHAAGGVPLIEYCGGTEIGGGYIASTVLHEAIPARFTTPTLGIDLVVLDEEGLESDVGEVFLIPPSIGMSTTLLNRDHQTEYFTGTPTVRGAVLRRHGDQIRRSPDGLLQVLGRVDDTMNLGGIKVSSADLEAAIGSVPGTKEVAAIAVPPPGGGPERLVVFAVPARGSDTDPLELRSSMQAAIRRDLNPLFKVYDVVLVDSLPRTASHKIMRRTLRDRYGA